MLFQAAIIPVGNQRGKIINNTYFILLGNVSLYKWITAIFFFLRKKTNHTNVMSQAAAACEIERIPNSRKVVA